MGRCDASEIVRLIHRASLILNELLVTLRRGISKIRLIDFDYVTLSSLNRHATASLQDVGTPKVYCIERTLKQISKVVEVDARIELWNKDSAEALLSGYDWVFGMTLNSNLLDLLFSESSSLCPP